MACHRAFSAVGPSTVVSVGNALALSKRKGAIPAGFVLRSGTVHSLALATIGKSYRYFYRYYRGVENIN